jgi:glycosyltransferase involved in cell wall biosynthesis
VAEADLDGIFSRCAHVFLPYARFRYFCPVSASVLAGLRRGRVVWVSDVNAMRETIVPGVNGLIFSGDVPEDLATYRWLREEPERQAAIAARAIETARAAAAFDYGRYFAPDGRAAA